MWIEDYRRRNGLELYELAELVNKHRREKGIAYGIVSDKLLHMLERDKNAVTHPLLANAIAEVCGATPKQRDMIVADIHKGTWPDGVMEGPATQGRAPFGSKAVVKLDINGAELCRYMSVADAARRTQHSDSVIRDHCKGRVREVTAYMPYTFRYADEWDAMDEFQKECEIDALKRIW